MKKSLLFIFVLLFGSNLFSQVLIDQTKTPSQITIQDLIGVGVSVSNITFNGTAANANLLRDQIGLFSNGLTSAVNIDSGVILSTGNSLVAQIGTGTTSPPFPQRTNASNASTTPIVGDDTNFGSADIAGGTIVKTFTIQNTGTAILNIGAISFTGTHGTNFTVTTPPSATVAIGGSTTFQVTFDPTIVGAHSAEISIVNDDVNENPYNFAITGNGFATPNIVLSSSNPAVAASNITQGTTNNVIYAFNLAVTNADATLNNVVFNTSGSYAASNITNFKLWYSTDATFNSATDTTLDNETAALGTGAHTFTGFTRLITNGSTGYFFITTDIPCASTAGNTKAIMATSPNWVLKF